MVKRLVVGGIRSALALAGIAIGFSSHLGLTAEPDAAEPDAARVLGSDDRIDVLRRDGTLLLSVPDVAAALGWQAEFLPGDRLLTFCRKGDDGLCVPVQLAGVAMARQGQERFLDAETLAHTLQFTIDDDGTLVRLRPGAHADAEWTQVKAYNADWGAGRGFAVGQTLPDIPLVDLRGREVRFSQFLGKQYIIYCWASW